MKKLTRKEAIQILQKYIQEELPKLDWYQNVKDYIKAIVFYGSTAKEQNREDSDLDFLIFIPREIEEKYTKGEYFYNYNGREINIVFRSINRLRTLENNLFEREVFRMSEFLYQKDDEVMKLLKKI